MGSLPKILIVEDDPAMQATLAQALDPDVYQLLLASNYKEGEKYFKMEDPDVVLLDLNLPDRSGKELFNLLKQQDEDVVIIILTAFPDLRGAIALMKAGAFDYLVKPFDLTELKISIEKGLRINRLQNEVIRLKRKERESSPVQDIIGDSAATRQLKMDILQIAKTGNSTVLITGETGTGKELVAHAIHANSPRRNRPLVPINCSAIPENLVESELFGHEKGAFSGATQTLKGVFELANGGTLFLDEVGEMPVGVQPKLLRALEARRIKRLGGSREIPIDIRLVLATNRNLTQAVEQGQFREDLYYRINVIRLEIPPLRERVEDILPLVRFSIEDIAKRARMKPLRFTPKALALLEGYSWPGNVREMKNLVERLMILQGHREHSVEIDAVQLPEEIRTAQPELRSTGAVRAGVQSLEEVERNHILSVMELFQGNKSEVSRRLGVSRNTLKEKLHKYELAN